MEPFIPDDDRVILAPGQRSDVILDMMGEPGARHEIRDSFYTEASYRLAEFIYGTGAPVPDGRLRSPSPICPLRS